MGGDAQHSLIKPHQPLSSSRRGGARRNFFPVGSVVEVRTDEEDFRGVFFSATVLPSPSKPKKSRRKKSRKLFVEYHNLLSHEDGSDHLREYVDVSYVRPEPPLLEIVKGFELDDVVDAFNRDGWWTGVVTRVLEGGERYTVTFEFPPDVLELGLTELRVHWDWVNGSWVRPHKQSMAGLMFDLGQKVEVSFDREELRDAWFPATIQEDLGSGTFSVEYRIADTDNGSRCVKATVDSLHLRPCPPLLKANSFVLFEKVDAFFDFVWWSGVISKELENSGYVVFFRQRKQDKTLNMSELRPHMEWKDGKWFTSSQLSQEASILSSDDGVHEPHTPESSRASGETALVDSSVDRKGTCDGKTPSLLTLRKGYLMQLTPDNQKTSHGTTSLTKRRQHLSDSGSALSQPLKKLKEGDIVGANKQDRHDVSVKTDLVNNMETSATETTGDQSSCDPSWGKKIRRQPRSVGATQSIRGVIKSTLGSMEKSITQVSPLERLEHVTGGKPTDAAVSVEEDSQNGHAKEETELPIIICLPCGETGNSEFGGSVGRRSHRSIGNEIVKQKQQLGNLTAQKVKVSEQSEIGGLSDRKKRGRPTKTLVEATQTPGAGDLNRGEDGSQAIPEVMTMRMDVSIPVREKMVVDKKLADGLSEPKLRKLRMLRRNLARVLVEKGVKVSVRPGQDHPLRRGRRRSTGENVAVQAQDFPGASGGEIMEDNGTVEVEKVIGEVPGNEFDDEPLSKWIEEMQTPSVIDGMGHSAAGTIEQCLTNGEERRDGMVLDEETGRQASALVDQGSIVSSELQSVLSMENTVGVVLAEDSGKQPENGTPAFALVDKGSVVPSEPQSLPSVEYTVGVVPEEDCKKQPESETQAPAFVDEGSIVLCEPPTLPFVKNTILWKTIESMEVFQRMPQKPHFQPLEYLKESSREGLAIGYMVTFSSLVERASKLQLNDPKSIMDDIVESLAELENYGFDVRGLQDRVTELHAVKENEEDLVDKLNILNNQILEHNHEKASIEQVIRDTILAIKQLQEKLSLAESAKDREDDEIAALQDRLKDTEEIIKNTRSDFEGIVSSILS